jgi:hypothetical protein
VSEEAPNRFTQDIAPVARRRRFRIELRGQIDQAWISAFEPLSCASSGLVTTIEVLVDQAALRGVLNHLWDLNLYISSAVEIAGPAHQNGEM